MFNLSSLMGNGDSSDIASTTLDEYTNPFQPCDEAFDALPMEEKHRVRDDLYGNANAFTIDETESFVQSKIRELEHEMNKIDNADERKLPYLFAVQQEQAAMKVCSTYEAYVTSASFRIMFLRSEQYNTPKTVQRLLMHFQVKLRLFGEDKLAFRITKKDLDENDKQALYSGVFCINGTTDSAGRLIVWINRVHILKYEQVHLQKVYFYILEFFIEQHPQAQKKGVVIIHDWSIPIASLSEFYRLINCIPMSTILNCATPLRVVAKHVFFTSSYTHENIVLNFWNRFQPKSATSRVIPHFYPCPSFIERFKSDLTEYGIYLDNHISCKHNNKSDGFLTAGTATASTTTTNIADPVFPGTTNVKTDIGIQNNKCSSDIDNKDITATATEKNATSTTAREMSTIAVDATANTTEKDTATTTHKAAETSTNVVDVTTTTTNVKNDNENNHDDDNNNYYNNEKYPKGCEKFFLPLKENCEIDVELLRQQFDSILL